jgi:hypothetical protein
VKSNRTYIIQTAIFSLLIVLSLNKNVFPQPLSGSYTVGGVSANFDSLSHAISALVNNGISGAVIFNILPGIYEEQVIMPEISGASSSNTITFQSETGVAEDVIWQFENPNWTNFNYVIRIDAADHLRFKNITFNANLANVTDGKGNVLAFNIGLCEDIRIENNIFLSIPNQSESSGVIDVYKPSSPPTLKNVVIAQNSFNGFGNGIKFLSITGGTNNSGLEIYNNTFESNPGHRAIIISSFDSPRVENNEINVPLAETGIRLDYCSGQVEVLNNKIMVKYYGIVLLDTYQNIPVSGVVANNMVMVNTVSTGSGIRLGVYANGLIVAHNTILATGDQNNGTALSFDPPGSFTPNSNLSLINNFFIHTGPGKALIVPNSSKSISVMDYNILFTNGNVLASWNGVDYSVLTDLQNASNMNLNSFSKMPDFKNPNEDLHLIACSIGDEELKGVPVPEVATDFDGQIRDVLSPYRGADETYGNRPNLFSSRIAVGLSDSPINFAAGDLDGDGDSDIAVVLGGSTNLVSVHWNNNGHFSSSTEFEFGLSPTVVKIADLDEDGKNDLICLSDTIFVRYGDGGGNFTAPFKMPGVGVNVNPPPGGADFEIADINDDGNLDILQSYLGIVGVETGYLAMYFGSGNRDFTFYEPSQPTGLEHPATIRLADMNNDNKVDVIVEDFVNEEIGVYENILPDINVFLNAVVYNTNHGGSGPLHANLDVYDFDGDNFNDIMLGKWNTIFAADTLVLLHNDGSTPFLESMRGIRTDDYRSSVTFTSVDYDLDGDVDILYATTSKEISILLNDGSGNFESIVACNPVGGNTFSGDALTILHSNLNSDNLPDIAVLTQSDSFYIYLNAGWIPTAIRQSEEEILSVNSYELSQNYPNPFNPSTTIRYSVPERSNVVLKIYDILGSEVSTLVNEDKDAGIYSVNFNASHLASGIYLYRLQAGSFVQTKKMIIIK